MNLNITARFTSNSSKTFWNSPGNFINRSRTFINRSRTFINSSRTFINSSRIFINSSKSSQLKRPSQAPRYCFFYSLKHFLSSFAAEPIRIAKLSLVAFERILSSFAAKPIRNATPCLVAFEPMLSSFAAKPIRIANLTLLPRDVCGYARANMAPLPRNQRCHSQKLVLLPFLV